MRRQMSRRWADAQWYEWIARDAHVQLNAQPNYQDPNITAAEDEQSLQSLVADLKRVTPSHRSLKSRLCLTRRLKRELYKHRDLYAESQEAQVVQRMRQQLMMLQHTLLDQLSCCMTSGA